MVFGTIPLIFVLIIASWANSDNPYKGDWEGFISIAIIICFLISIFISYFTYLYYLINFLVNPQDYNDMYVPPNPFFNQKKDILKYEISQCDETFDKDSAKI